jgi:tetratricopeptide (TPR) repeat protein
VVATKPTENPDAYLLYLRARELEIPLGASKEDYEAALKLYQQAIDLDPKFALARARWSRCLTHSTQGDDPAREAKALAEAEEALRLQPNLGEGRLALTVYNLWVTHDYGRALAELSRAEELLPNSAEVWTTRAYIYKRQDKLRDRIAALQHAETLDPRDMNNLSLLLNTFASVRNWPEAARTADRINALLPETKQTPWIPPYFEFRVNGRKDFDLLKKSVADRPDGTPPGDLSLVGRARYEVAMLERDYAAAERYLRETEAFGSGIDSKLMQEGLLSVARGAGPAVVEHALVVVRQEIEKRLADAPTDGSLHSELGLVDAFRGRKEDAVREGRRGVELAPGTSEKNDASAALALIYARTGEPDEAIKLIEKLLTVPADLGGLSIFNMTQADLKLRWVWDPLRKDPRFQKILAGPEPKTVY